MNDGIDFVDLVFHGYPGIVGTGVIRAGRGVWLVDPGPPSALDGLRKGLADIGLSMADVRGVLLTHIHLDHAGASGTIVREHPDVRVYVHERGAPHVIDPSRLLDSAGRLYGDSLGPLWGDIVPAPEANVVILHGGERLDLDGRAVEVAYTPGHASHHVCYFDATSRAVFAGDTAGVRLPPTGHLVPPTPPPDIDLQAWTASIARIRQWQPSRVYLTHFGGYDDVGEHLTRLENQLRSYAAIARSIVETDVTDEERLKLFIERVSAELRSVMPEDEAKRYQLAVPLDHCWLGLNRYWRKRKTA